MSASKHSSAPNDCPQWVVGSTGGRNTSIFDEMGVEAMKRRQRIYYTAAQRSEIWDRWQRGESMSSIGRGFDRESSDRKSKRLNSSHYCAARMPSSAGKHK